MSALLKHYTTLFAFNAWANERQLNAMQNGAPEDALRYVSHVLAAEHNWLGRLQKQLEGASGEPMEIFPLFSPARCAALALDLSRQWRALLAGLTEDCLENVIDYTNNHGKAFSTPLNDVLNHVITHSMHHRAQAQSALRQAGHTPADIGYIAYSREKKQ